MIELAEPYLLRKLPNLGTKEIILIITVFNNSSLQKRYQILEQAETILLTNVSQLTSQEIVGLLYFYAKQRIGSKLMIERLVKFFATSNPKLNLSSGQTI